MTTGMSVSIANPSALSERAGFTAKKKSRRAWRWVVGLVVLAGVAFGVGPWVAPTWFSPVNAAAQADRFTIIPRDFAVVLKEKGELKASKSTDIICEVEGRTRIISLIPEGTAVKEGDLLVTLASDQIEEKTRQEELKESNAITAYESARTELEIQRDRNESDNRKAQLQIELRKLELERYQLGDWERQLKDHHIAIDQAKIALERRREDFDASKQLREKDFITETEYEEDDFNYKRAQWDLEKAEKALDVLEKYSHVSDLRLKESDLEEAIKEADRVRKTAIAEEAKKQRGAEGTEKELALVREQLAKLRGQKEKCRLTAPTQGFVVYYGGGGGGGRWMSNDSQIREGAEVYERQILMQLPDTS
ncbi:MAG: hypothetical protein AABZ47_01460 [Planctomycetota bacterium]